MMALSKQTRVLVYLQKNKEHIRLANFTDCVLSFFGHHTGIGEVYVQLKENHLMISDTRFSQRDQPVLIKHPSFCPILNLKDEQLKTLPEDVVGRGIDTGVAFVLESYDGKVLLSRRAQHLRTFPGIWVPPGGHVESNESLIEAGLREVKEETGLSLSPEDCEKGGIKMLALWESVFPPKLSVGLPKRHHIVVYFHAKLKEGFSADCLEDKIEFDPNEVGACAWLDRKTITSIVEACEETSTSKRSSTLATFRAVILGDDKKQCKKELPLDPLLNTLPPENDGERVSTGTKFALEQFLKL